LYFLVVITDGLAVKIESSQVYIMVSAICGLMIGLSLSNLKGDKK